MAAPSTAEEIRHVNVRYHDAAASGYDSKWGISYGPEGRAQVLGKMRRALGERAHFERALEIGAGTGYFTLNLLRAGAVDRAVATDISPGMLAELQGSAARLGVEVETACCQASELPFPDDSFDLVFGHAVLHHLPDLDAAFAEFRRVLRPGGRLAFCGEPSHHGDRLASVPKRAALAVAPAWRRAVGARRRDWPDREGPDRDHWLEHAVDVHAFTPGQLESLARRAGLEEVRVSGEELVAGWFGWMNRTLESTAEPEDLPRRWIQYAYYGYLALKQVDARVLEGRLPPAVFYNLLLSARAGA
ncbi:MAG TPA: class I SAM-dependent methyltransferase [Thermoleophilaceae bacterium]|jgi:ubiquinone/menaquinone biosynthesis C-methylase UbiE